MTAQKSDEILARLMQLHPKIIDLSLDRMEQILKKLGHPERRLPPVLHVSGTNGKGSLLAYLRAILEVAGFKIHVYTSPHLVRFAERIRLAGETIDETQLSDVLTFCEKANGPTPITYFEITTAAAFHAFAETPADILLLETGLGGRLDATNMVARPEVTAITPVSQDHAGFLGTDLGKIAGEKAGIMRPDVPVVIGPQSDIALAALKKKANGIGAVPYICGENWSFSTIDADWSYKGNGLSGVYSLPALHGVHQTANAATALACLEQLKGFDVTPADIKCGLQTVHWPARMQRLIQGPLVDMLPDHVEVWLDGGHNPAAAEQICKSFAKMNEASAKPTYLIAGMLNTKDQTSFFAGLKPIIERGYCVPIDDETAATPENELAQLAQKAGLDMVATSNLSSAVKALKPVVESSPCRLLIAGSLYLAGQILRENT